MPSKEEDRYLNKVLGNTTQASMIDSDEEDKLLDEVIYQNKSKKKSRRK